MGPLLVVYYEFIHYYNVWNQIVTSNLRFARVRKWLEGAGMVLGRDMMTGLLRFSYVFSSGNFLSLQPSLKKLKVVEVRIDGKFKVECIERFLE